VNGVGADFSSPLLGNAAVLPDQLMYRRIDGAQGL
jgi:hypothetical protein